MDKIRAIIADSLEGKEIDPRINVEVFVYILRHWLIQYDEKLSKKEKNSYRLSHYMKAVDSVKQDVKKYLKDNSVKAMTELKKSLEKRFAHHSAVEKFIKDIDVFLHTGERPNLIMSGVRIV